MPIDIQRVSDASGFSHEAVRVAIAALHTGGGKMAQFTHHELGGSGQWMPGMVMISDMFNSALKGRVDALFSQLAGQLDTSNAAPQAAGQHGSPNQPARLEGEATPSLYARSVDATEGWFPRELGLPSVSGKQNDARYAYFPESARLAIQTRGVVTIYDTRDHLIESVMQEQSDQSRTLIFTSQHGVVPVGALPIIAQLKETEDRTRE